MKRALAFLTTGFVCSIPCFAAAQDQQPVYTAPPTTTTTTQPPPNGSAPAPVVVDDKDSVRFRGGISGGGGFWVGGPYTAVLGGLDGHLGVQINKLFGVYAVPHLSFGSVSQGKASGLTGVASVSGIAEVTLIDRIFIGAGGGVGVLNNPAGPMLHFRLGGYPVMSKGKNGRRTGLMLAADLRVVFLGENSLNFTAVMPFFSVGYEAY